MTHTATCHCRATRLTIPRMPEVATACTCTFCTKKGVLWGYFSPDDVVVEADGDSRLYGLGGMNQHHFCGTCGCATWSLTPDWTGEVDAEGNPPKRVSVNLWLLNDVDVRALPVEVLDGLNSW